jgi:hypothetical protein
VFFPPPAFRTFTRPFALPKRAAEDALRSSACDSNLPAGYLRAPCPTAHPVPATCCHAVVVCMASPRLPTYLQCFASHSFLTRVTGLKRNAAQRRPCQSDSVRNTANSCRMHRGLAGTRTWGTSTFVISTQRHVKGPVVSVTFLASQTTPTQQQP